MQTPSHRSEKILSMIVPAWIILLHLCVFFSAGALWRDEANSAQQAQLPTWGAIWDSLHYDSFPALYPMILRAWCLFPWNCGDQALRLFGLVTGLCVLLSIWKVAWPLAGRAPLICLALFAADSLVISEGDSIRPYGIGILFLIWAFGCFDRLLEMRSMAFLALAVPACVLAVQASYANALMVGVLSTSAFVVAVQSGWRRRSWLLFLPGLMSALSLLPYAGALREVRGWSSILSSRVEWLPFFQAFVKDHTLIHPLLWIGFSLGAICHLTWVKRRGAGGYAVLKGPTAFSVLAAPVSLATQVLFVAVSGVSPFPRYFLPSALFLAFALEALLAKISVRMRSAAATLALLLSAAPAWGWLSQRHTNMDRIAEILERRTQPRDLIVISPWFLHPSFQRYYRGEREWVTVPELNRHPMTRYDLIKNAMMNPSSDDIAGRVDEVIARGGEIWFVSQRPWTNLDRREAPERPISSVQEGGWDYVRFRSFWEREIEFRLRARCRPVEEPVGLKRRVREEEDLVLTRWSAP